MSVKAEPAEILDEHIKNIAPPHSTIVASTERRPGLDSIVRQEVAAEFDFRHGNACTWILVYRGQGKGRRDQPAVPQAAGSRVPAKYSRNAPRRCTLVAETVILSI